MRSNDAFLFSVPKGLEAHKYKSTLDCALKILRYEGLAA